MRHLKSIAGTAALVFGLIAMGAPVRAEDRKPLNIIMVTHGVASDTFWAPVKKGAEDAARDVGATLSYQAPDVNDMVAQANLIRSATSQKPDGLIVTVPNVEALGPAIREAVDAGIPTVSFNSGMNTQDKTHTMFFIGEDLYQLGVLSGKKLAQMGGKKAACLNVEPGNTVLDSICQGLQKGFGSPVTQVPFGFDPAEIEAKTRALLESNPDIDTLVSMSTSNAPLIADVVDEMGMRGKVRQSTLNLSPQVLEYIRDGRIAFTMDQQPYLQGYLPGRRRRLEGPLRHPDHDGLCRLGSARRRQNQRSGRPGRREGWLSLTEL